MLIIFYYKIYNRKKLLSSFFMLSILGISLPSNTLAQDKVNWDDTSSSLWPKETTLVEIKSSMDNTLQKSYIYKSRSSNKMPLIISLHTWGGNYAQRDPLLKYCIVADVNYIHPDFRGPNTNPKAGGSEFVVQDIDDAIQWAIDSLNVDLDEIHIVGVSGGGFATALSYLKTRHRIKSFHAFVGIYNLENWYYESLGRKNNYDKDILAITGEFNGKPNPEEVKKRSPLLLETPINERKSTKLHLYAGLHDGYNGSVPISHSLEMYNKVVNDFNKKETKATIPTEDILYLLKRRTSPNFNIIPNGLLGRDIIYQKKYKELVEIIVFEGGHEMPNDNLLNRIFSKQ